MSFFTVTLKCSTQTLVLRTNAFAWPFSWLDIQILITGYGHYNAQNIQNGHFVPTLYQLENQDSYIIISQFLASIRPDNRREEREGREEEDSGPSWAEFQKHVDSFCNFPR